MVASLQPYAPIKYKFTNQSLQMDMAGSPLSIRENEFEFLKKYIIINNLKTGFELGTGFGISTAAIGLGFRRTGGHLISMDAYTEEKFQSYEYVASNKDVYRDAIGYKSAKFLMKELELENTVDIVCGWSPTDIPTILKPYLQQSRQLDFVFIDAMHNDESVMNDLTAIFPFMSKKFVLFLHDVHCFSQSTKDHIKSLFGKIYAVIPSCSLDIGLGYNLAIVNRL